jgi:hypothetical protein
LLSVDNASGFKLTGSLALRIMLFEHTWYTIASLGSYPKNIGIIAVSRFLYLCATEIDKYVYEQHKQDKKYASIHNNI